MLAPERRGVGRLLATLGLLTAGCTDQPLSADVASPEALLDTGAAAAGADEARASVDEFGVASTETQDISLPSGAFLEIDDLTGTGGGSRDTNLCASGSDYSAGEIDACPSGGSYGAADNPNYPGPDNEVPDTLGTTDEDYLDWADLLADDYIVPFVDRDVNTETLRVYPSNTKPAVKDDIFSPGVCVDESGSSPSKANFGLTGFAANDTYFYLLNARETSNGNEAYHYFATKSPPRMIPSGTSQCDEIWVWDVQPGDVHIELKYPSTSGLPFAVANVYVWGGEDDTLDAAEMIAEIGDEPGDDWDPVTDEAAFVAINTRSGGKALAGEDNERFFDGALLPSGLVVEVALDIEKVFGSVGCGLQRTISGISTASEGGNDDLKDFLFPVTVVTGELSADVIVKEVCPTATVTGEKLELGLAVQQKSEEGGEETDLTASADIVVTLDIDCDDDTYDDEDVVVPASERADGKIELTFPGLAAPTDCDFTIDISGVEGTDFAACNTTATGEGQVLPDVEPAASLNPDCSGNVAYDGTIQLKGVSGPTATLVSTGSGSPNFSVGWAFTVGGVSNFATSTTLDGSFAASSSGITGAAVSGTLTLTDLRLRDLDGDGEAESTETCPTQTATQNDTALRPLSVELVPTSGDGTCEPDGNANVTGVNFNAVVKGGSGSYIFDWTLMGDADLDANDAPMDGGAGTCANLETAASGTNADVTESDKDYLQGCSFDIGTDYCASGSVKLEVTDTNTECGSANDTILADRTSSLDVTPNPAP